MVKIATVATIASEILQVRLKQCRFMITINLTVAVTNGSSLHIMC